MPTIPEQKPTQNVMEFGIYLLNEIKSKAIDPKQLTDEKRRLCVYVMMVQQTFTIDDMAAIMNCHRNTISRDKKIIREENGTAGTFVIDENELANELIEQANHAIMKLNSAKKYRDAWIVKKECAEMLQSLGYVKRVEQKFSLRGAISLMEVLDSEQSSNEPEEPKRRNVGLPARNGTHSNGTSVEQIQDAAD